MSDVDRELRGLASSDSDAVARAARRAGGKAFGWMSTVTVDDESLLERAIDVRDQIDTFRRRPKGPSRRANEDFADAVAICFAASLPSAAILVMNDTPARRAALAHGISSVSARDVLEAMVRDGQLRARRRDRIVLELGPHLDVGD